ncbi:MAG: hypothetical protein K8R85_11115 [Bacteroidetes bacterium]|nr:hypothetical protein [Bacteroidota bacterium]
MKQVTVENNQSIWDLAIQYYGSVDGIKQLILDNATKLNLNDSVVPGTKIIVREEMIINKPMVDYLKKKEIKPATAVSVPSASGFGDYSNDYNNDYL